MTQEQTFTARFVEAKTIILIDVPESDDVDIAAINGRVLPTRIDYGPADEPDWIDEAWEPERYDAALAEAGWERVGDWGDNHDFTVRTIPPVDLVGLAEIAEMAGVQRETVQAWTERHANFPAPVQTLAMGRVWRRGDVADWIAVPRGPGRPRRSV